MLSRSGSNAAAIGARATGARKGTASPPEAKGRAVSAAWWVLVLLVATEREAKAYTDPGTGALLWQMLAAGFVGLLFYFRKFLGFLRKKGKKTE